MENVIAHNHNSLPDPSVEEATLWLSNLNTDQVHNSGWIEINARLHGMALAARTFLNERYPDAAERKAAFDGMTIGLLAMVHFTDIRELTQLFEQGSNDEMAAHPDQNATPPAAA